MPMHRTKPVSANCRVISASIHGLGAMSTSQRLYGIVDRGVSRCERNTVEQVGLWTSEVAAGCAMRNLVAHAASTEFQGTRLRSEAALR